MNDQILSEAFASGAPARAAALEGQQASPPAAPQPEPVPQPQPPAPPLPLENKAAGVKPVSPEERKIYETRRSDLIKHGGESLEKILTDDKYARIRNDFGLGGAQEYRDAVKNFATDPESLKELRHATLRDIVTLDLTNEDNPHFLTNAPALKRLTTNRNDIDTQIKDATGLEAKKYDPVTMGEDERALREAFREQLAQQRVEKGPELYIRYTPDKQDADGIDATPAISQAVLKDGTHVMIVGMDAWKRDKAAVTDAMKNELKLGHYAEREMIEGYTKLFGKVPIKDIITRPEYAKMRKDLNLPDFSGATDPDQNPHYVAGLDPQSLKALETHTLKETVGSTSSGPLNNAYSTYQYPSLADSVTFPLLDPKDHMAQLQYLESIGGFGKSKSAQEETVTAYPSDNVSPEEARFLKNYADMATNPQRMGFDKPPELYVLSDDSGYGAQAVLLKDGTRAIVMDKSVAELPVDQRLDVLGHEDAHLYAMMRKGQHTTYDLMREESEKEKINKEALADRIGEGPHGTYDAAGLLTAFETMFDVKDPKQYNRYIDRQLEELAMGQLDHPLLPTRLATVRQQAEEQAHHPSAVVPYFTPKPPVGPTPDRTP